MGRRKRYLKMLAFVPAIVLVGGFVGCHAGAFSRFSKPEPKPEPFPPPPEPTPPNPPPQGKPTYMPGAKSMMIGSPRPGLTPADDPPATAPPQPNSESKPPIIMGGPKSAPVFTPSPPNQPTPP
jgi:hypothetical protein